MEIKQFYSLLLISAGFQNRKSDIFLGQFLVLSGINHSRLYFDKHFMIFIRFLTIKIIIFATQNIILNIKHS